MNGFCNNVWRVLAKRYALVFIQFGAAGDFRGG
jgi:hypothetical protein